MSQDSPPASKSLPSWPLPTVNLLLFFLGSGSAICATLGLIARFDIFFELMTHFYLEYFVVLLVAVPVLFLRKQRKQAALLSPFLLLAAFKVLSLYVPDPTPVPANAPRLRIVQTNVNTGNRNYNAVIKYVLSTDADIAAFEEVDQAWIDALQKGLKDKYPFFVSQSRADNFGIALLSKRPLLNASIKYFGGVELPCAVATVNVDGKPVTIVDLHVLPPMDDQMLIARNQEFKGIGTDRSVLGERCIIIGDFNSSSWSPYFEDMLRDLKLKDSRMGYGVQPSWPTMSILFRTTIDHLLTSEHFVTVKREIGPEVGSDHYPVYAEVALVK